MIRSSSGWEKTTLKPYNGIQNPKSYRCQIGGNGKKKEGFWPKTNWFRIWEVVSRLVSGYSWAVSVNWAGGFHILQVAVRPWWLHLVKITRILAAAGWRTRADLVGKRATEAFRDGSNSWMKWTFSAIAIKKSQRKQELRRPLSPLYQLLFSRLREQRPRRLKPTSQESARSSGRIF